MLVIPVEALYAATEIVFTILRSQQALHRTLSQIESNKSRSLFRVRKDLGPLEYLVECYARLARKHNIRTRNTGRGMWNQCARPIPIPNARVLFAREILTRFLTIAKL
jgi:hypothetical protein